MTQNSPKKGPGYVISLLKYKSPSKKDQAATHNSFKKRTKPQYTTHSKKDQAGWWCWVVTSLNVSNSKISPIPTLLKFLPKTLISHADSIYRLWVVFYKIGQKLGTINLVGEHLLPACCKGGFALSGWHGN